MHISIVIPTLNEADTIQALLRDLQSLRQAGHEVLVVDGGSRDETCALARRLACRVLTARTGRATQMNTGAAVARGEVLWFLHADTRLNAQVAAKQLLEIVAQGRLWGRFVVRLSGKALLLRFVETLMNLRSRLTGIATGDQGIFVRREVFEAVGGFPDQPLMEDIALSKRLRRRGHPACVGPPITTSSRRWETQGICRTILLMWRLRLAYALGADPRDLARRYQAH